MEFGMRPHQADLMDELWRRSSLRYVAQVKTPTLLIHGENDNDVPIAESEQFYIALKDVGGGGGCCAPGGRGRGWGSRSTWWTASTARSRGTRGSFRGAEPTAPRRLQAPGFSLQAFGTIGKTRSRSSAGRGMTWTPISS